MSALENVPQNAGLTFIEQLHALSVQLCPNPSVPYLTGIKDKKVILIRGNCDMWSCPVCGARNGTRWLARLLHHINHKDNRNYNWYFLTITAHEKWRGTESSLKNLRQGWNKLRMRIARRFKNVQYVKVFELHKDNSFHMHLLINHKVGKKWLKDNARACGMGYQCDSSRAKNGGQVAGYVSKYLIKSFVDADRYPKNVRRIQASGNWLKLPELSQADDYIWKIHMKRSEQDGYVAHMIPNDKKIVDMRPENDDHIDKNVLSDTIGS